jgi:hypothetical protein
MKEGKVYRSAPFNSASRARMKASGMFSTKFPWARLLTYNGSFALRSPPRLSPRYLSTKLAIAGLQS